MQSVAQDTLIKIQQLLTIEKEEDYRQYQEKMSATSLEERIKTGISWYPLVKSKEFISTGERITLELSGLQTDFDSGGFQSGTNVNIFKVEGSSEMTVSGVVSYLNKQTIRIILNHHETPEWIDGGRLGINLLFDDITYREMESALKTVIQARNNRIAELREIFYGTTPAIFKNGYDFSVQHLNSVQNQALTRIMNSQDLVLVHGPPGTGKTTTLVQAIKAVVDQEKQVLVCAPSNAAVDFLVEKLLENDLDTIRLGHPARLTEAVIENSLDVKISRHPQFKNLRKTRIKAEELRKIALQYKRHFGKSERKQRMMILKESKSLRDYSHDIETYIIGHLLEGCQVIACTITGANHHFLKDKIFKTVFIDESSQSLEPACWIPIVKANRVIMSGDHLQLPPTVKSIKAAKQGLEISLFEKAIELSKTDIMLTTQYRMADVIKGFSSQYFYGDALVSDKSIAERKAPGIFEFVDTAGCGFEEKIQENSLSTYNMEEAKLLLKHLSENLPTAGTSIGIIAPYKAQINTIRTLIQQAQGLKTNIEDIKVNTVDAFQGQERDIIYISMTRSNNQGIIGFLKEYRRMNVALTRARIKLVIIGDSSTLGGDQFYKRLIDYVDKAGTYKSAFEYMS